MDNDKIFEKAQAIKTLFANSISSLAFGDGMVQAINKIVACKGKIVVSGIGKAGIAARKFSSILCSLGIPSCFLHPSEAQHGDLGVLSKNDLLFVCSVSGKTREIIELVQLAKFIDNNILVIGLTSHIDSPIRKMVDIVIDMGEIEEAGSFKITPTTSILIILAITDIIALIASEEKGFTEEDYLKRHHSGYLSDKLKEKIVKKTANG